METRHQPETPMPADTQSDALTLLEDLIAKARAAGADAADAVLFEGAVAMARVVPEDPFCGIADPDQLARDWPDLDISDPSEPAAEELIEQARIAEETALAVPGVTNSE